MPKRNSTVYVLDDRVEKLTDNPGAVARKYELLRSLAVEHDFVSPRVLATESDRVVLEKLEGIVPIAEIYLGGSGPLCDGLMEAIGRVLGHVHQASEPAMERDWAPPAGFNLAVAKYLGRPLDVSSLPRGLLHCDYGFANIFVTQSDRPRVVIIDPCANFGSTFDDWTRGPVFVDLGKMLSCLEGQVPARRQLQRPSRGRIEEMQRRFLAGYEQVTGQSLDVAAAHAFAYAVAEAQFRRRFGGLGKLHTTALYNPFRGNFPAHRKINKAQLSS